MNKKRMLCRLSNFERKIFLIRSNFSVMAASRCTLKYQRSETYEQTSIRVKAISTAKFHGRNMLPHLQNLNISVKAVDSCACLVHSIVSSPQLYHIKCRTKVLNVYSVKHACRLFHHHECRKSFIPVVCQTVNVKGREKRSKDYLEISVFPAHPMDVFEHERSLRGALVKPAEVDDRCLHRFSFCSNQNRRRDAPWQRTHEECSQYMRLMDNARMGCGIFIGFVWLLPTHNKCSH